jgi:hypothetical protein
MIGAAHGALALATTYYVSQSTGSDANAGTSATAPWKSAPGMASYTGAGRLVAGDVVYFNRADTWLVTGTQGIYLVGGVTYVGNAWGNGTRATLRANADLESAVVRFRDDPSVETVFRGFDVDANGKVASGVEMNHSFYAGPLTGATKRVDSVVVHNVASRTSLGQYKYGIIISNHGGAAGEVANVEIIDSVVHDISRDGLPLYPGDESAACIIRNIVVRGNTVYNTGQDPDYGAGGGIIVKGRVQDATIENNYVTATKGAGIFFNSNETRHYGYGPTNVHVRYNIVNVNTSHGSIRIYDGASGADPKDIKVYGNIVYNNALGPGLLLGSDVGNTNSIRIYNNTFFNNPVVINSSAATFPILEWRNNVIQYAGTALTDTAGKITSHANNLYYGGTTLVSARGTAYGPGTLASYEPTASAANPGFVDTGKLPTGFTGTYGRDLAPNTIGLSAQSTAYVIDHGSPLGAPFDGSINSTQRPAGNGWDIGAYESAGNTRLPAPTNLRVVP